MIDQMAGSAVGCSQLSRSVAMKSPRCRFAVFGLVFVVSAGIHPAARVRADEPKLYNRTLPEWIKMLQSDPKPERRQGAVLAIEVLGAKSRESMLALGKAVRSDADDEVRRSAAQLLGAFGPDARDGLDDLAAALKAEKSPVV